MLLSLCAITDYSTKSKMEPPSQARPRLKNHKKYLNLQFIAY